MNNNTTAPSDVQHYHFGIDAHLNQWVVTVRTNDMGMHTFAMPPSPEGLQRYARKRCPGGVYHSAYEAGFCGFWIHRRLTELDFDNTVCHAADIPTTQKQRLQRTDKRDSRKIAEGLEKGTLNAVYVPDEPMQHLRSLCRLRFRCRRDLTRIKNRVKAFLHFNGIAIPPHHQMCHWSARFLSWLESLRIDDGPADDFLACCIEDLKHKRDQLLRLTRRLRHYCNEEPHRSVIGLLLTVPGIGFLTAATLYTEIIDIDRFPNLDNLASQVGLIPCTDESDETSPELGLTPRKNAFLSSLIIEASWVAIRHDPDLMACFAKLSRRMKKQEASVRIARKLLNRVRYVWKNRKPCQRMQA